MATGIARTKRSGRRGRNTIGTAAVVALCAAACGGNSDDDGTDEQSGDDESEITEVVPTTIDPDELRRELRAPEVPYLGDPDGWTGPDGSVLLFTDHTEAASVELRMDSAIDVALEKDTAIMMGGAGAGDFDRDGDTDLFVIGGGNERDALFVNDGDGTFTDMTVAAGLDELHLGSSVSVGDYDGDGWLDMFVGSHGTPEAGAVVGMHRLYRNNGDGTFTDVAREAGVNTTSLEVFDGFGAAFGDIDLDGDLDLFVPGWQRDSLGNRLFENNGDGTFTDITEAAGIVDDGVRGFSACLVDTSGDRYPELLLVADFGTSQFYVNDGTGSFSLRTIESGAGIEYAGMGTAVGDVNNDGLLDWYATAIFDQDEVGRGTGSALYLNMGDNKWDEVTDEAGVADGGWGWGTVTVDVNNDGWLDIVETNGWDLPSYIGNLSRTWINDGQGGFDEVAEEAGPLHNLHGLGIVQFDLEGDGDQDIAMTASNDEFRLYRNDLSGSEFSWLRVFLDTSAVDDLAPDGVGALVRATVGDSTMTRTIGGCSNFNSTSELSAHFGLGMTDTVDRLVVEWPNGDVTELTDVDANQTLTITAD